ncbi:MAG TPA: HAD family hydrolase [Fimbriimonas sp.]|nr:HAD family hydrolase [Fimbriimonas sp.]
MIFADVKAVFFDLDDTLCGYWSASAKGLRETFEQHGPQGVDVEDMLDHWAAAFREFFPHATRPEWYPRYLKSGEPTRTEQMRRTLERLGSTDLEHAARLSQAYMEARDKHLELFPEAISVLKMLKTKYPLGLITNGPADIQRMEIATLEIEEFFDHIFIEGELGFGKPEAEVFRRAAYAVGREPNQILFVGNSFDHDMKPAIAAGWKTAWMCREGSEAVSSRKQTYEPPKTDGPQPDAKIGDLRELLPMLGT